MFPEFGWWLWQRAKLNDIPALYSAFVFVWQCISPPGARGAARALLPARVLAYIHFALSVARLRSVVTKSKWPTWFKHACRALPPQAQSGVLSASVGWFSSVLPWLAGQGGVAAVYLLFGHAGTYIGKANLVRAGKPLPRPGLPDRLLEHMVGLLFTKSRDGSLARYKLLRVFVFFGVLAAASCV